jgi:hypothetical protein
VLGCLFHIAVCSSCTSVLHVLRLCNKHPVSLCPSAVYISDEKWQSFIVISPKLTAYIYINKNLANTTGWSPKFAACQCCLNMIFEMDFLYRRILTADSISFQIASTFIFKWSLLDDVYWQVVKMCSWLENNFGSLSERDWGQLYFSMYKNV